MAVWWSTDGTSFSGKVRSKRTLLTGNDARAALMAPHSAIIRRTRRTKLKNARESEEVEKNKD